MHIWSNKGSTVDCRRNKLGFVVVAVVVKINVEIYLDYIMLFLCENQWETLVFVMKVRSNWEYIWVWVY